jgi:hypothetical protein
VILILAVLFLGPLAAGVCGAVAVDAALSMRDLRRDSAPPSGRIGGREPDRVPAAAGVLVLRDAGAPHLGHRARVPHL